MTTIWGYFDRILDDCFNLLSVKATPIASHKIMTSSASLSPHRACSTDFITIVAYVKNSMCLSDLSRTFLNDDQGKLEPKETQLALPSQKANLHLGSTLVHSNIHRHVNIHFFEPKLEQRFLIFLT